MVEVPVAHEHLLGHLYPELQVVLEVHDYPVSQEDLFRQVFLVAQLVPQEVQLVRAGLLVQVLLGAQVHHQVPLDQEGQMVQMDLRVPVEQQAVGFQCSIQEHK